MAEFCPKFGLYPRTIWVPHSQVIIQLSPLLRSPLEPSDDIISGVLLWIYWNSLWNVSWAIRSILVVGGNIFFQNLGIWNLNFCNLLLILILKPRFNFSSSIKKQSSEMSIQVVWVYWMAVTVCESIGEDNRLLIVLFCLWYILSKDGEYLKGWNWGYFKWVTIQCPSFFLV